MRILTVPGLWNSGTQHWQTHWEAKHPTWTRVQQREWDRPDRYEWVATLDAAIGSSDEPAVLAAPTVSDACSSRKGGADRGGHGVVAAFLVAPSDVEGPDYPEEARSFSAIPLVKMPFPSIVVASSDDPYVSVDRARQFASVWGSRLVLIGSAGHIDGASGHGLWPEGEAMLLELCAQVTAGRAAET